MYSLNVPVPTTVAALAGELAKEIPTARARRRGEHTLVVKRLPGSDRGAGDRLATRLRESLAGTPAFEAQVSGIDAFCEAVSGPSPVVYLAVESPGLESLHADLCREFEPVEGMEGPEYRPHVTIARGGDVGAVDAVLEESVDPITWTVDELVLFAAEWDQTVARFSLPV